MPSWGWGWGWREMVVVAVGESNHLHRLEVPSFSLVRVTASLQPHLH